MPIDKKQISEFTRWNISEYESLVKYIKEIKEDLRKDHRISSQKCVSCYYRRGGLAMQAFKLVKCRGCEKEMTFSSSVVDKLCNECAVENSACIHCAGSIDLMSEIEKKKLKSKISKL